MDGSPAHLSDAALLARCRREPDAFVVVYDRHAEALFRLVLSWCREREAALDVVRETFARALRDSSRFRDRGDGSAFPWLRTIARNLVHDWRRHGVVQNRVRCELGILEARSSREPHADLTGGTDERRELRAALARLPRSQREAVAARVVFSATYDEIAADGGISQAARRRLSRRRA